MTRKRIAQRPQAKRDASAAANYYADEAGDAVAQRFAMALQATFRLIAEHPASGSPRYAQRVKLPNLRMKPVRRFPYLVFYVEQEDHIEIWRVLHGARDIPASLRAETSDNEP